MLKNTLRWILFPSPSAKIDSRTYKLLMIDASGIGIANSAAPFLTVFLVQLGATNLQIGLMSSMPAFAGFLTVLFVGRFIQHQPKLTNWASFSVLMTYSAYFFTGLLAFFVKDGKTMVVTVLLIWAAITIPQTLMGVAYPAMLRKAAGEAGRFELTTRRWAFIGLMTTIGTAITGEALEGTKFPLNYQIAFMVLSLGGLISFLAVRSIHFEESVDTTVSQNVFAEFRQYFKEIRAQKPFLSFVGKRFVHFLGATLTSPVISLYYIREVGASARWIGLFSTTAMATLILGYFFWLRTSRRLHSRKILLLTVFVVGLYPLLLSFTKNQFLIMSFLVIVGFFQAGIDLVFFDELMKTIPPEHSSVFISVNMLFQYLANAIGPLLGTALASLISLRVALIIGSSIKLIAFILFALDHRDRTEMYANRSDNLK